MHIYKFGGTSVGSAEGLKNILHIIDNEQQKIILVSANGKSTDMLDAICISIQQKQLQQLESQKEVLWEYYQQLIQSVFPCSEYREKAQIRIDNLLKKLVPLETRAFTEENRNEILATGELISSNILHLLLLEKGINHTTMYAPDIIHQNEEGEVSPSEIRRKYLNWSKNHFQPNIIITQGYICSNSAGHLSNLGRGGSDLSASLMGQATQADVIQIWSDVDGFLNNDPGFVETPKPLHHLSFGEAAELAYFGARILHPLSLAPAQEANIPVLLKNTFHPNTRGTLISTATQQGNIKAIAARDNIISITIKSSKMLMAYGYLRKIFAVFEKHQTAIDLVSTSEISVTASIDQSTKLELLINDLKEYGEVSYRQNLSIICVVGDHLKENQGKVSAIFNALSHIEVRMISYGSSHNSITFLVDQNDKTNTLNALHEITSQHTEPAITYNN